MISGYNLKSEILGQEQVQSSALLKICNSIMSDLEQMETGMVSLCEECVQYEEILKQERQEKIERDRIRKNSEKIQGLISKL
jgi:hypothetical protein